MSFSAGDAFAHVAIFTTIDIGFHLFLGFSPQGAEFLEFLAEEFNLTGGLHGIDSMAHGGHAHGAVEAASNVFESGEAANADFFMPGEAGFEECLETGHTEFRNDQLVCHAA
tara:strand:- start:3770 stop:4105 length:336 start_codon:yes stop_codon:yes gene_type:complete